MNFEKFSLNRKSIDAAALVLGGITGLSIGTAEYLAKEAPGLDLSKPVEVAAVHESIQLRQDGKIYEFNDKQITAEIRQKLAEQHPEYKEFLEGGPINIIKP